MKKLVLLLILALPVWAVNAQQSSHTQNTKKEKEVWQKVEALTKAIFETRDAAALEELVHEKVSYGHSGGAVEDKAMMIKKATSSATIYKNISLERLSLAIIKKTAIVRHILRATSLENDVASPLNLSILQVWMWEKGKWRLLGRQAVKIAPNK